MSKSLNYAIRLPKRNPLSTLVYTVSVSAILVSGSVGALRNVVIGPATLTALLTVAYASSVLLLLVARPVLLKKVVAVMWPFLAFLLWGFSSFIWFRPNQAGLQNLLVISAFLGFVLLVSYESYRNHNFVGAVKRALVWSFWLAMALYAVGLLIDGLGASLILGARSFALFAMLGVAYYLSEWRHGYRRGLWRAVLLILLIGASVSRTALFVALALFPLSQVYPRSFRSWAKAILVGALIVAIAYGAIVYVEPLRERFSQGDLYNIGGFEINTSGRAEIWGTILSSYLESPWIGLGAGSSEQVIAKSFGDQIAHPHNDYLRVLHDYGAIGLSLVLLGIVNLLRSIGASWWTASRKGNVDSLIHMTAFLTLTAVTVAMITTNPIVYIFIMLPLGILVGASLGRSIYNAK